MVVANKTDGIDADSHCAEFYQLGLGEIEQIAASQGRGVTQFNGASTCTFSGKITRKTKQKMTALLMKKEKMNGTHVNLTSIQKKILH